MKIACLTWNGANQTVDQSVVNQLCGCLISQNDLSHSHGNDLLKTVKRGLQENRIAASAFAHASPPPTPEIVIVALQEAKLNFLMDDDTVNMFICGLHGHFKARYERIFFHKMFTNTKFGEPAHIALLILSRSDCKRQIERLSSFYNSNQYRRGFSNKGGCYEKLQLVVDGRPIKLGVVGVHLDSNQETHRRTEVNEIMSVLKDMDSVIFMGDLNENRIDFSSPLDAKTCANEMWHFRNAGRGLLSRFTLDSQGHLSYDLADRIYVGLQQVVPGWASQWGLEYRNLCRFSMSHIIEGEGGIDFGRAVDDAGNDSGWDSMNDCRPVSNSSFRVKASRGGLQECGFLDNIGIQNKRQEYLSFLSYPAVHSKPNISDHQPVTVLLNLNAPSVVAQGSPDLQKFTW